MDNLDAKLPDGGNVYASTEAFVDAWMAYLEAKLARTLAEADADQPTIVEGVG